MKDIFISYRRKNQEGQAYGTTIATLIYDKLNDARYEGRVFLDHQGIENENFEEKILKTIRQAKVFILLLTQDTFTFDRCQNNEDWVRREISEAKKSGLEIIVINYNNEFKDYPENFPEELCWLKRHNRQIVRAAEFSEDMTKLINNIIGPALKRKINEKKVEQRNLRRQKIKDVIQSFGGGIKYIILGGIFVLLAFLVYDVIDKKQKTTIVDINKVFDTISPSTNAVNTILTSENSGILALNDKPGNVKAAETPRLAKEEETRKEEEAKAARLAKEEETRKAADAEAARLAKEEEARTAAVAAAQVAAKKEVAKQEYLALKDRADKKFKLFYNELFNNSNDKSVGQEALNLYEECMKYKEYISQEEIEKIKEKIETIKKYL